MKKSEQREAQVCAGRCGAEASNADQVNLTVSKRGGQQCNVMNPFVDWSFKHLFGTERNKRNLIGLLNMILEGELDSKIVEIHYLNNESISSEEDGRECVFDILCEDETENRFLIEVQNAGISYIRNRMLYYTCRLIDQMGKVGNDWNYNIDKVYSICLMNFTYEQQPTLRRDFLMCEPNTENILTDRIHIIMLQLPCLQVKSIDECAELYEKLLFLLLEMKGGMKTIEELKREVYEHGLNEEIRETFLSVLDEADLASLSKENKAKYEAKLKSYRDNRACLDYAIENGILQGIAKGEAIGMEKGIEKGIEKGREESKHEIAKSMKLEGVSVDLIVRCTGLSVAEVNKL